MNIAKTDTGHGSTIIVSGCADLRDAAELKAALIESLDSLRATELDVSAVEHTDVTFLQLVWAAAATFRDAGIPFSLKDNTTGSFGRTASANGFAARDSEGAL